MILDVITANKQVAVIKKYCYCNDSWRNYSKQAAVIKRYCYCNDIWRNYSQQTSHCN